MGKEIYHALLDPAFQNVYVDIDEMRTRVIPGGGEVVYRYIHGGFPDKNVKFSFCFPEKNQYQGRFFQYLCPFPGPDEEVASLRRSGQEDQICFALIHGAYFVESNMGSQRAFGGASESQLVWKSSAAVAEYGRKLAMEIYETTQRPVGIVYGGSGGGYKSMACIENTDAWEGAVPYVIGSPASLPNTITMHVQGERVLRNAFKTILDNIDAGGCGDPYAGLTEEEAAMLKELTLMGFPPIAWYPEANGHVDPGSLPVLTPGVKMADPQYFEEFWTVPGYEGADPNSGAARDRFVLRTTLRDAGISVENNVDSKLPSEGNGVDDAWKKQLAAAGGAWLEIADAPACENQYVDGTNITFLTGAAAGKTLLLNKLDKTANGSLITLGAAFGVDAASDVLKLVKPGDELLLDNSDYVAIQSYYRHQVPEDSSFHAWDQFRNPDGSPKTPQRPFMGYGFSGTGTVQDGNIHGKVLQVQALADESTCPWCADWYREQVLNSKGSLDDMRTYFFQRCMHGDTTALGNSMVVNYLGGLYQAILDLADWIQHGKQPLDSTVYQCIDNQIEVASDPVHRKGMQADVKLTANGEKCAHVKTGEAFTLRTEITVPENAGLVTGIYYDFSNDWSIPAKPNPELVKGEFVRTDENGIYGAVGELCHSYDKPGTYFIAVKISTQRTGDASDPYTQVLNLDRVRVIVEES